MFFCRPDAVEEAERFNRRSALRRSKFISRDSARWIEKEDHRTEEQP